MPLFKSAEAQSIENPENKVIIFEESLPEDVVEMPHPGHIEMQHGPHEVSEFQFNFPHIPDVGGIEVSEDVPKSGVREKQKDEKPKDPWDWSSVEMANLIHWIQDRLNNIPDMSHGFSTSFSRAKSYLEKLNNEISKAISVDYNGEIDVGAVQVARNWINTSIIKLKEAHENTDEGKKKKKSAVDEDGRIVKEARTPYTGGIIVTVPLIISRCARVCINGTVSAGHDLPSLYREQVKKYSLNTREQAELVQHLSDMGFPLREDRLMLPDEEVVVEEGRGDLASNYYA